MDNKTLITGTITIAIGLGAGFLTGQATNNIQLTKPGESVYITEVTQSEKTGQYIKHRIYITSSEISLEETKNILNQLNDVKTARLSTGKNITEIDKVISEYTAEIQKVEQKGLVPTPK